MIFYVEAADVKAKVEQAQHFGATVVVQFIDNGAIGPAQVNLLS